MRQSYNNLISNNNDPSEKSTKSAMIIREEHLNSHKRCFIYITTIDVVIISHNAIITTLGCKTMGKFSSHTSVNHSKTRLIEESIQYMDDTGTNR